MVEPDPGAANNQRLLQIALYDRETIDMHRELAGINIYFVSLRHRIDRFIETLLTMQTDCVVCNEVDPTTWEELTITIEAPDNLHCLLHTEAFH